MFAGCPDELPNPHKSCLREMLNTMICNDQDVKRLNTELRNMQLELKAELDKIERANLPCAQVKLNMMTKDKLCDPDEDLSAYTKRLVDLDEVQHFYTKRFEEIRKRRDSIIVYGQQCLQAYSEEKCKFKSFHENTVDYIKRTASLSNDPVQVQRCERDICEFHKRFVKEVANLKQCEAQLQPFFKLLKDTDQNVYCECCCFKDYDWMPAAGNKGAIDDMVAEFKAKMGTVLVAALANLHCHMPQDMHAFLAGYLMNVERNEQEVKEKLDIFQEQADHDDKNVPDPTFRCEAECERSTQI